MSTIKANNIQIGQSATSTQNFVLAVPATPDGTIKLSRGSVGATTADVLTVDASNGVKIGALKDSSGRTLIIKDAAGTVIWG